MNVAAVKKAKFYKKLNRQFAGTKRARRRLVRYSIVTANLALLVGVAVFVAGGASRTSSAATSSSAPAIFNNKKTVAGPLDQYSAVDIAVNIARSTDLTEAIAVTNQSDSAKVTSEIASVDTAIVAKPQIVSTNSKSAKDMQIYVAQLGDTISTIAAKFNVTSDSIRWSNNLTGDKVRAGTELSIPPVNGIVYIVKPGDTAETLAQKYQANKDQIIAFNDAEVGGLTVGKRIVIPNGQQPAAASYRYTTSFTSSFSASYGYNGYDRGWCTWYVASKISVPTNWGNANTWDDRARLSGWTVSSNPRVGAIAQTNRGWAGHVGIVEAVSPDGSMIKYSDMNGIAGFNRVGYSDWVPISKYSNYIYR